MPQSLISSDRELRSRSDFALGLLVGRLSFDSDQKLLVEDGEDALQDGNRRNVTPALNPGDKGMGSARLIGYLFLSQIKLIPPFTDVRSDPISLA
jgi:hypothetical protein